MLRTAKERNLYDAFKVKINWSEKKALAVFCRWKGKLEVLKQSEAAFADYKICDLKKGNLIKNFSLK